MNNASSYEEQKRSEEELEQLRIAAESGDKNAIYEYGKELAKRGSSNDVLNWLNSCELVDAASFFHYLGSCYLKGNGVEKDEKEAFQWFLKAADQGNAEAQNNVGICYLKGDGVEKDEKEAFQWFLKAAEQRDAEAQYNVGACYLKGDGVEKDEKNAFQWFLKAAEQELAKAQNNVGTCYSNGDGVEKDEKEAFQWFLKAAEQKLAVAQYNVGICYLNGGGVEKDEKEAFQWFLKAAEQELAKAQNNVGACYLKGDGVEKDEKNAFQWFLKATEQELAEAQYNVGICYFYGNGVEEDEKEAFQWFLKAAEQEFFEAQFAVGYCYLKGVGVKKDEEKAYHYLFKAAENGSFEAQCLLGVKFNKFIEIDKYNTNVLENIEQQADANNDFAQFTLAEMEFWGNDVVKRDRYNAAYWYEKIKGSDSYSEQAKRRLAFMNYFGLGTPKNIDKAKELWQEIGYSWERDPRPVSLKELLICYVESFGRNTFDTPECSLWDKLYIPLKRLNYSRYSNVSFEKFLMFCNKHHDIEPFPSISIDVFWNILMHYEDARQILHNSKKPAKLLKAVKEGMRDVFEELCEEDREFLGRVNVFFSIREAFDVKKLEPWSIRIHNEDLLSKDSLSFILDSETLKSAANRLNSISNGQFSRDLNFAERVIRRDVASCIEAVEDESGYYDYETRSAMNDILESQEFSVIVKYVKNLMGRAEKEETENDVPDTTINDNVNEYKNVPEDKIIKNMPHIDLLSKNEAEFLAKLLAGKENLNGPKKYYLNESDINKFISFFSDGSYIVKPDASKIRWIETWPSLKKLVQIIFDIKDKQAKEEKKRQADKKHPKHVKMPTKKGVYENIVNAFVFGSDKKEITVSSIRNNSAEKGLNDNEIKILENMAEQALGIE